MRAHSAAMAYVDRAAVGLVHLPESRPSRPSATGREYALAVAAAAAGSARPIAVSRPQ
jgi:hypothetical protein